ncbi:ATP-dependent zinc protease [Aeromonas hydrophila]|uniref:retropepsin-like aspartic peptidase RloA3 n=1 Tax=Aeromonas hydrophila TaxID=644 RepID=UPI001115E4A3|nr:ATP-dependent zinc protease [Aeromonas hydrophila]TNH75134.1 ATP-dependent zinc protease [Aeromonas hydrophila]
MFGLRMMPLLLLVGLALPGAVRAASNPAVYGWIEKGLIMPSGVAVKMKLDTGALTSSLDARDLRHFKRDGKSWVRFTLQVTDANTDRQVSQTLERPVEHMVTVRGAGGMEQRPTVTMSICLGDKVYEEWFTLRDRSKMIYPVLLGRRLLAVLGAVDSSRTFTVQPSCR